MTHLIHAIGQHTPHYPIDEVAPQGHLSAVEGCLLHHRNSALCALCAHGQQGVGLIGCIAEEVALEDGVCSLQLIGQNAIVGFEEGLELLYETQLGLCDVNHQMVL